MVTCALAVMCILTITVIVILDELIKLKTKRHGNT